MCDARAPVVLRSYRSADPLFRRAELRTQQIGSITAQKSAPIPKVCAGEWIPRIGLSSVRTTVGSASGLQSVMTVTLSLS